MRAAPLTFDYECQVCWITGQYAGKCNEPYGSGGPTFTLSHAQVGQRVAANVTAVDHVGGRTSPGGDGDEAEVGSNVFGPILPPAAPVNVRAPSIMGSIAVGDQVTVDPGSWTSPDILHYSYAWWRCAAPGVGCGPTGGGRVRTLTARDSGRILTVRVTATDQEQQSGTRTTRVRVS